MLYVLSLPICNLIIVSKNNLQWSSLPAFSYAPPAPFEINISWKNLDGVFAFLRFFGILVVLCMRGKFYILIISRNMTAYFAKLAITRWFNSAFLFFNLAHIK